MAAPYAINILDGKSPVTSVEAKTYNLGFESNGYTASLYKTATGGTAETTVEAVTQTANTYEFYARPENGAVNIAYTLPGTDALTDTLIVRRSNDTGDTFYGEVYNIPTTKTHVVTGMPYAATNAPMVYFTIDVATMDTLGYVLADGESKTKGIQITATGTPTQTVTFNFIAKSKEATTAQFTIFDGSAPKSSDIAVAGDAANGYAPLASGTVNLTV